METVHAPGDHVFGRSNLFLAIFVGHQVTISTKLF